MARRVPWESSKCYASGRARVNGKSFPSAREVVELTRFAAGQYHQVMTPEATSPLEPRTAERDERGTLDAEWDDVFAWSYGPRLWNVGCG